jgi:hypothetical protein
MRVASYRLQVCVFTLLTAFVMASPRRVVGREMEKEAPTRDRHIAVARDFYCLPSC